VHGVPARQDQLQSHQFATQRVVAALLTHDPDPARSPFRHTAAAAFAGILLAVVALAGAAVYGLLTGTGEVDWRAEGAILVEKESGARYVYLRADDKLHPVLNYASALLAVHTPDARVVLMPRAALAGAPLGVTLGIPGAPDSLPPRDNLRTAPWTLCSTPAGSTLLVGVAVSGGRPLAIPKAGGGSEGLLVSTVDGQDYLVYAGRRYRIPAAEPVLAALGWRSRPPVRVAAVLVNAVPSGPDLRPPAVANRGRPSGAVPGATIGQLVTAPGQQTAVVLADGVYDLTELQAALLFADPAVAPGALTLSTAQYGALHRSAVGLETSGSLPTTVPNLVGPVTSVCVTDSGILLDPVVPDAPAVPDAASTGSGAHVDRVLVPRGSAALVEAAAAPSAPPGTGTLSLVTDAGIRYPLANRDLPGWLGYRGLSPQRVPAGLVTLLPSGPALDPAALGLPG
jgi:type VII secretion protein EccB